MFVWGGGTLYNLLNIYTEGEIKGHFPYGGNWDNALYLENNWGHPILLLSSKKLKNKNNRVFNIINFTS